MKLSGTTRRGRHLNKNVSLEPIDGDVVEDIAQPLGTKKKRSKKKKALIIVSVILCVFLVAAGCVYLYVRRAIDTPPQVREDLRGPTYIDPSNPSYSPSAGRPPDIEGGVGGGGNVAVAAVPRPGIRNLKKYTFLLLATDDGSNTDVIMAATLDVEKYTLEVVSIPRDTLANVSWSNKKANSIYANMRARNGWDDSAISASMDDTVKVFADILGYEVDYWFLVDMQAVAALVNAVDGVDFYVPVRMYYHDPAANLYIDYPQGMQYGLNGKQALEILRFRSGYSNADIGRIGTQQSFLTAAAEQILAKQSSINVVELANIFLRYVKTDISLDNLIWFANQLLKLDSENINFDIVPANYWDDSGYVTIYVEEWLELVNEKLNPYYQDIDVDHVSIYTRGANGRLYVTDGSENTQWSTGSPSSNSNSGGSVNTTPSGSGGSQSSEPPPSSGDEPDESGDDTDLEANPPDGSEDEIDALPPADSDDPPEDGDTTTDSPQESSPPDDEPATPHPGPPDDYTPDEWPQPPDTGNQPIQGEPPP